MEPRQILAQLLKGRESTVPVGRFTFTIQRPTEMELMRMKGADGQTTEIGLDMLQKKIVGWSGVLESDILPGGASDPVPFDRALWERWIEDRQDLWPPIVDKFLVIISEYRSRNEALAGN